MRPLLRCFARPMKEEWKIRPYFGRVASRLQRPETAAQQPCISQQIVRSKQRLLQVASEMSAFEGITGRGLVTQEGLTDESLASTRQCTAVWNREGVLQT